MLATATPTTSMNAPSLKDPFNNNCRGTSADHTRFETRRLGQDNQ